MNANLGSIQDGMDVYDVNGEKIGSVAHVWASSASGPPTASVGNEQGYETAASRGVSDSAMDVTTGEQGRTSDYGMRQPSSAEPAGYTSGGMPVSDLTGGDTTSSMQPGTIVSESVPITGSSATGYFQVNEGGIMGLGAKHLYIPLSAVQDVDPGNCLTLNCVRGECEALYNSKPEFIEAS